MPRPGPFHHNNRDFPKACATSRPLCWPRIETRAQEDLEPWASSQMLSILSITRDKCNCSSPR